VLRNHYASRGAYQAAMEQFGKQGLIELTMLIGPGVGVNRVPPAAAFPVPADQ
jgi:hypothetical protein